MSKKTLTGLLALGLCLGLGSLALAQDTTAPATPAPDAAATAAPVDPAAATATPAPDAAPADGVGTMYIAATNGDWEQRCIRTEDGSDPCQMYQLLKDENANAVAEMTILPLPDGQQAVAGSQIMVPLETLLTEQLILQIDSSPAKIYPFTWCAAQGCVARIGFTAADIAALKKGANATITIVPVVAPDQKVKLTVSLKGFTAAYDAAALTKGN
ncbi:MAG: invasion associated locus B family protein [Alphaproteobacteria bacterium]|nr:invasion associated locus B family protein [Alphaproteobacteria bacterium]